MASVTKLLDQPEYGNVKGWLSPKVLHVVEAWCVARQQLPGIGEMRAGSIEIGVHHGKLLIALEHATPLELPCYGLDVFADQHLNIDGSGKGDEAIFLENVQKLAIEPQRVHAVTCDSFSIRRSEVISHRYDLISIDGGHTKEHACFDLTYANDTLEPGGLILLDDFTNVNWLGVMEGAFHFLSSPNRRIAPFAAGFNKLFLTTVSEADTLRQSLEEQLQRSHRAAVSVKRLSELFGNRVRGLT